MSIKFTSKSGEIEIGAGNNPSPNFNITTESIRKDSVNLGNKYNITVTGTLIVTGALNDRETNRRNLVKNLIKITGEVGTLTIVGQNPLVFTDCIFVSSDAQDQDDVSRGIQNQDYTLTFEAYDFTGSGLTSTNLSEISETWETSVDDGTYSDIGTGLPQTIFTITQTLSATGITRGLSGGGLSGYISAKNWVNGRISQNPISTIPKDLSSTPTNIDLAVPPQYSAYNRISQISQDILEGTYSVTTTWQTSRYPATSSIEFQFTGDETADAQTVQVNITINGLSSIAANGGTIDKYNNAKEFYEANIKNNIAGWASSFYSLAGGQGAFNVNPVSFSRSDNQTDGVITITQSFDDKLVPFSGASNVSLNITYNNEDGGNKTIAILPIIAKAGGPIIQDMQTTAERKRSISLDVTMRQGFRITKPSAQAWSYIQSYIPNVLNYRENKTETWNPISGNYTLSADFVWTDSTPSN